MKSDETTNTTALAAGTRLAVTLREDCSSGGSITRAVLGAEGTTKTSTPSGLRSYSWTLPQSTSRAELAEQAESDGCVTGISEDTVSHVSALDPHIKSQGHLAMVGSGSRLGLAGVPSNLPKVTIAVVDTGIDTSHEDLKNVLWKNPKEIPGNGIDDDGNGYVDDVHGYNFKDKVPTPKHTGDWPGYQHGTHVAGLAAAQAGNGIGVMGAASGTARIMALNVFGQSAGAFTADIANAIRYAADNGASIINLSVGGIGRSAAYESALAYALKKGVTIIAAAGNEARQIGSEYFMAPAAYSKEFAGMIAVGSVDAKTTSLSGFSNFGSTYVELAAPGAEDSVAREGLLSTWPGNKYSRIQGTSMAAPVVAGGAALAISMMKARGYKVGPATVEGIVQASGTSLQDLRAKIRDGRVINLSSMVDFIEKTYPQTQSASGEAAVDPGVPGYDPCLGARL